MGLVRGVLVEIPIIDGPAGGAVMFGSDNHAVQPGPTACSPCLVNGRHMDSNWLRQGVNMELESGTAFHEGEGLPLTGIEG